MNKITNAQQIIDIIAPIPKEKFITYVFGDASGNSCFLGHIHRALNERNDPNNYMGDLNGYGARELTYRFLKENHCIVGLNGVYVNNTTNVNGYTEPEIKDRVMHLLNDMKEAGY